MATTCQRILNLARAQGLLRSRDLAVYGMPRGAVTRLLGQSLPSHVRRGCTPCRADLAVLNKKLAARRAPG